MINELLIAGTLLWCPASHNYGTDCPDGLMFRQKDTVVSYYLHKNVKGKKIHMKRIKEFDEKLPQLTFKRVKKARHADIIIKRLDFFHRAAGYIYPARFTDTENFRYIDKCIANVKWEAFKLYPNLLDHEIGHCLGLAHYDDDSSFMWPSLYSQNEQRVLPGNLAILDELYQEEYDYEESEEGVQLDTRSGKQLLQPISSRRVVVERNKAYSCQHAH